MVETFLTDHRIDMHVCDGDQRTLLHHLSGSRAELSGIESHAKNPGVFLQEFPLILCQEGVDVNSCDAIGQTPLVYAAALGIFDNVQLLLTAPDIDVSVRDRRGRTAFHHAVRNSHLDIIKVLLDTGSVNVEETDGLGDTALIVSAALCDAEVMRHLIEGRRASVAARNTLGFTAFHEACFGNKLENLNVLARIPSVKYDDRDRDDMTPLMKSAGLGHAKIVKFLVNELHVDVNNTGLQSTALHCEISRNHLRVVKVLLNSNKVDLETADNHQNTPLISTVAKGNPHMVGALMATERVNLHAVDDVGRSALDLAVHNGHLEITRVLIEAYSSDVQAQDHVITSCTPPSSQ